MDDHPDCEYCDLKTRYAFGSVIKRKNGEVLDQYMCNLAHSTFFPRTEQTEFIDRMNALLAAKPAQH